ncbi:oxidoreductase [Gymnopilus junonius]|uniref:Oxidoreductase n=1 Tax=Gymnopilus junonius TaxID=109634 RepID=A0A9P5TG93_GYMJU|nr:oxidoreductase [Gymnopilus junonius]
MLGFASKKWNPSEKHVYITGGSSGLGLSLAHILAQKGAHISIVARNQKKLDEALESIEKLRVSSSQIFNVYSHALDSGKASAEALELVCKAHGGGAPDAVFACAGSSKPMFFVEMDECDLTDGMTNGYWIQAWTAWAAAKKMAREHKKQAKIVLISSTLGYMSFVGWGSYSPAKHALRGLADTLHSELMLYDIDVHIYFPATMFTPGFDEENKTKPEIVRRIESTDDGQTADQAAQALYKGVVNGHTHITGDLITALFSASTRGAVRRHNWLLEGLYDFIAYVATPIWRSSVDRQVVAHREQHQRYLTDKGFFS